MLGQICLPAEIVYGVPTALVAAIGVLWARMNAIVDRDRDRLKQIDDDARDRAIEEARHARQRPR